MDGQGLHWPGFQRVKKRKIEDRLCFSLAVEAQHQGDFEVVEQEDASTHTADHESNDQEEHAIQKRVRFDLPAYNPPETSLDHGRFSNPRICRSLWSYCLLEPDRSPAASAPYSIRRHTLPCCSVHNLCVKATHIRVSGDDSSNY
jgi:hypothetical protein